MSLLETILCAAIAAVILASLAAFALGSKPYAVHAAVEDVRSLVDDARALAQTTGNGSTIVISSAGGSFTARLYPYRPFAGADMSAAPVRVVSEDVFLTPSAIFIDTSGTTAQAAGWTPQSGTLESEPSCSDATQLTFSDGARSETHTIPCGRAELQ